MDFATIIGLLLAWGAVVYSMFHASHGALGAYVKPAPVIDVPTVEGAPGSAAVLASPLLAMTADFSARQNYLDAPPAGVGFTPSCDLETAPLEPAEAQCQTLAVSNPASLTRCLVCWKEAEL